MSRNNLPEEFEVINGIRWIFWIARGIFQKHMNLFPKRILKKYFRIELIKSFRNYDKNYRENMLELEDSFQFLLPLWKSKVAFLKVCWNWIKLFHIYIFMATRIWSKRVEDGRKFYEFITGKKYSSPPKPEIFHLPHYAEIVVNLQPVSPAPFTMQEKSLTPSQEQVSLSLKFKTIYSSPSYACRAWVVSFSCHGLCSTTNEILSGWAGFTGNVGGFLVTGSSNAFNQIIEKDLDKLMTRTVNRPLPTGRMSVSEAMWAAILMGISGVTNFVVEMNPLCGVLSLLSLLLYVESVYPR